VKGAESSPTKCSPTYCSKLYSNNLHCNVTLILAEQQACYCQFTCAPIGCIVVCKLIDVDLLRQSSFCKALTVLCCQKNYCIYDTTSLAPYFTSNIPCQLSILGHDGNTLGMNGTQVGIFKETNKVHLSTFRETQN